MIRRSGSGKFSSPPGGRRFATTKGNTQKVKHRLRQKKRVSARKLSMERRYFREKCSANNEKRSTVASLYEPLLSNDQKIKRKNICKLASNKFWTRGYDDNSLVR